MTARIHTLYTVECNAPGCKVTADCKSIPLGTGFTAADLPDGWRRFGDAEGTGVWDLCPEHRNLRIADLKGA